MTAIKLRNAGTFSDATTKIAGELSAATAGQIIGTSPSRIYAAADRDQANHSPLNLEQALSLDVAFHQATGREGPFLAAFKHQYRCMTQEAPRPASIVSQIGDVSKEFGEAIHSLSVISDPNGDGGVATTPNEALRALKEIYEAIHALDSIAVGLRKSAGIPASDIPVPEYSSQLKEAS